MLKRYFDWTPRDIAYWEKIQAKGFWRFFLWYGLGITGGGLFVIFSLYTFVRWFLKFSQAYNTSASRFILFEQLIFTLIVCLLAGIINGLLTWWVEQRQYRKYKSLQG